MMRDIGKNIRDLRQQKHLTQEELAAVSYTHLTLPTN